ncbi:hypothetical protein ACCS43_28235 [Rhizobium ruizarguesonis]
MEITIYSHERSSAWDECLVFYPTLDQCRFGAAVFRDLHLALDPTGAFEGPLAIYEVAIRLPDPETMVELLNAPNRIFEFCLINKTHIGSTAT